ncbi:Calcium-binding EF hand family protein [Rhynchospora pubera]|uniref:Calcium-binding EF hand family protein n=1 Tax=Rhynchospora pubera TaxID=906938 RepID=A0AAV8C2Z7_9POAL|nr:Calcium-binding EF hand family protein [Rhynchospora pubera]
MAKASPTVLFLSLTFVVLLYVLLASFPHKSTTFHHRHRRLNLRSHVANSRSGNHTAVIFDPLIADFEQRFEDRQWEQDHFHFENDAHDDMSHMNEWEEYMKAENFINDEESFNITDRIIQLFPLIDVSPSDGRVSAQELATWHLNQGMKQMLHRTEREMQFHDKDKDGFISFSEYEPPAWASSLHDDKSGFWGEEHFNASDVDGNGLLNLTEFNEFLHPSEESNPKTTKWLCKEIIRQRDSDKDGKLDFKEFLSSMYENIKDLDLDHAASHDSSDSRSKDLFMQLDLNHDGYLSEDEVMPTIAKLHPSEIHYAKDQAKYIMSVVDVDNDGFLSLKEMIDNEYAFYGTVFQDEEDIDYYHDEFR